MAKIKAKNINFLAEELKNKFNGIYSNNLKIGIIVCTDSFEKDYSLSLANAVKDEVLRNSCEAEVVSFSGINERFRIFCDNNYILQSYKKQIADFFELTLLEKAFDGVVFIPSGLSSTIGCILSSIRLNLPTLILNQGLSTRQENYSLNQILQIPGQISQGKKSSFDLEECENKFCEYSGSGSNFSSENIFNSILEIMELTLKDNSTIFSQTLEKLEQAKTFGKKIVELAKNRLPLKKMINKKSIQNAFILNFCLGGSPVVIDALLELACESGVEVDINKMLNLSLSIPVLFDTKLGYNKFIEFGGTWGLIKSMIKSKIIDGNYKNCEEITFLELIKKVANFENFAPIKKNSLTVLRGNIAERYCVAKTINIPENFTKIILNAQVFSTDQEACNAVLNKAISDNSAIIIKESGKKTETGASTIAQTLIALESMEQTQQHIVITDGFAIDDTSAICISLVCPDSTGGNIRYLKDGDEIEIDFVKGKINAEVGNREFLLRQKKYIKENKILPKYLQK